MHLGLGQIVHALDQALRSIAGEVGLACGRPDALACRPRNRTVPESLVDDVRSFFLRYTIVDPLAVGEVPEWNGQQLSVSRGVSELLLPVVDQAEVHDGRRINAGGDDRIVHVHDGRSVRVGNGDNIGIGDQ